MRHRILPFGPYNQVSEASPALGVKKRNLHVSLAVLTSYLRGADLAAGA